MTSLPIPNYALLNSSRRGLPAVIVVNDALHGFEAKERLPWHLSIAIDPRYFADQGMPTTDEAELLARFEEQLEESVVVGENAAFLARVTWNRRRDLHFRVHDPAVADKALKDQIASEHQHREWSYEMKEDHDWAQADVFFSLLPKAAAR